MVKHHFQEFLEFTSGKSTKLSGLQDKKLSEDSIHDIAHDQLDMSLTSSVSYVLQLCDFGLARKLKDITKTPFCRKVLPTIVLFMLATYLASMSLLFGLQNSLFLSQNCTTTLSTHSFSLLMHLFGCHTRKVPPFTTWLLE
ncbi:hypothetical protein RHGRI_022485 [Rhododendron griersonianum]|uniref:Protein kinase domain-containing protein n=1 Tax=Rhododendron griersonianum TaxID=479676 RepID=A0AAV6J0X2_9ERIC|nr:hypothetical protein RHGRI_022485 [Rhododendron griersonianum]